MNQRVGIGIVAVVLLVGGIGGCDREPGHWEQAAAAGSIEAYDTYLQKHPDGAHAAEAKARAAALIDARQWKLAADAGTIEAYRGYLSDQTAGAHRAEAEAAIESLRWDAASKSRDVAEVEAYLAEYPEGRHAGEAANLRFERVLTSHTWLRRNIKPGDTNTPRFRFNEGGTVTVVSDSSGWNRWKLAGGVLSINDEGAFRLQRRGERWLIAGNQGAYEHEMTPAD